MMIFMRVRAGPEPATWKPEVVCQSGAKGEKYVKTPGSQPPRLRPPGCGTDDRQKCTSTGI